ncbi:glycosyltransferase family 4 protein [Halobacillus yeomjeoni]|uniref:Glycosyltransferase family 4 protein n=1 Tax=Halobacillus yeomjeoni TaxID=311194 RepID=A0A931HWB3_9BACI|nr:glycosyltransferase family 4 protein [Halobacillus yeomjeoni]MBH0230749.1 glycosyltransferase family 4 protein [Halobacillus yeomjeoni]
MKIATIHDACFYEENGEYYCNIIDYQMLIEFLRYFDSAQIVVRKGPMKPEYVKVSLDNINVEFVEAITAPKSFIFNALGTFKKIKNAVLKSDAVYCRGINGIIAQRYSKRYGIPHFAFLGGCIYDSMKNYGSFYKNIMARIALIVTKKSIYNTSNVVYCSNYLKKRYPTSGKEYLWSEVKIIQANEKVKENRFGKILNNKKPINIGLIGYVNNKIKGIDTAIKALSILGPNYQLKILGGGDHSQYDLLIKDLNLEDRVTFCGVLKGGDEVFSWLDEIDIYIQPSLTEGLPKATLEAISRGCPVISTNVGGLPDIVDNKYLHKPKDNKQLAKLLSDLSANPSEMKRLSNHSFKVADNYLSSRMEKVFVEMMADIVEQARLGGKSEC